ncbi:Histidine kinase [Chitinophaga sp. CF118]|uniref:sensor histidine kinase n=1 Tax=Chitinophaga sp. CF118 TaxID=1884367 RepID=UPI0008F1EB4F|nr:histidine kinase [Chitinophaga sp. CF118]SFF09956.1 Histidine kinase [Chitinophaga sp. CF118]
MDIIKDTFLSNKGKRILFVFFAFLLLYLVAYIIDPYSDYWINYFERSTSSIIGEWVISFLSCLLISESSIFIQTKLNKVLPWTENPVKRLVTETVINVATVLFIIFLTTLYFYLVDHNYRHGSLSIEEIRGFMQWIIVSLMIAFIISAINTGNYLIVNWKNTAIEAAEHKLAAAEQKQVAMEAELQALKLQIDPHFVFNNLSVLSELILEDQQLGHEYAENFSKVYRYLLVNSKKDVITLEEELRFLNAYVFLLKNRAGEGVIFNIEIDKTYYNYHLPPLTLQLLIENALKHNKTLRGNPLIISISSNENEQLVISNTLIPLEKQAPSSKTGLNNIINRYRLLGDSVPEITNNGLSFTVSIPLLKYDTKHTDFRG